MTVHGFPDALWAPANEEAKGVLMPVAHARQIIAYSDVVPRIRSISFLATDQRFFFLLREISAEEYRGGRGMPAAVAVARRAITSRCPGFRSCARSGAQRVGHGPSMESADQQGS